MNAMEEKEAIKQKDIYYTEIKWGQDWYSILYNPLKEVSEDTREIAAFSLVSKNEFNMKVLNTYLERFGIKVIYYIKKASLEDQIKIIQPFNPDKVISLSDTLYALWKERDKIAIVVEKEGPKANNAARILFQFKQAVSPIIEKLASYKLIPLEILSSLKSILDAFIPVCRGQDLKYFLIECFPYLDGTELDKKYKKYFKLIYQCLLLIFPNQSILSKNNPEILELIKTIEELMPTLLNEARYKNNILLILKNSLWFADRQWTILCFIACIKLAERPSSYRIVLLQQVFELAVEESILKDLIEAKHLLNSDQELYPQEASSTAVSKIKDFRCISNTERNYFQTYYQLFHNTLLHFFDHLDQFCSQEFNQLKPYLEKIDEYYFFGSQKRELEERVAFFEAEALKNACELMRLENRVQLKNKHSKKNTRSKSNQQADLQFKELSNQIDDLLRLLKKQKISNNSCKKIPLMDTAHLQKIYSLIGLSPELIKDNFRNCLGNIKRSINKKFYFSSSQKNHLISLLEQVETVFTLFQTDLLKCFNQQKLDQLNNSILTLTAELIREANLSKKNQLKIAGYEKALQKERKISVVFKDFLIQTSFETLAVIENLHTLHNIAGFLQKQQLYMHKTKECEINDTSKHLKKEKPYLKKQVRNQNTSQLKTSDETVPIRDEPVNLRAYVIEFEMNHYLKYENDIKLIIEKTLNILEVMPLIPRISIAQGQIEFIDLIICDQDFRTRRHNLEFFKQALQLYHHDLKQFSNNTLSQFVKHLESQISAILLLIDAYLEIFIQFKKDQKNALKDHPEYERLDFNHTYHLKQLRLAYQTSAEKRTSRLINKKCDTFEREIDPNNDFNNSIKMMKQLAEEWNSFIAYILEEKQTLQAIPSKQVTTTLNSVPFIFPHCSFYYDLKIMQPFNLPHLIVFDSSMTAMPSASQTSYHSAFYSPPLTSNQEIPNAMINSSYSLLNP